MNLYNLLHHAEDVNFAMAVRKGLGTDRGLFFPADIPELKNIDELLEMPFVARSSRILHSWLRDEISEAATAQMVERAFNFALPVTRIDSTLSVLELFHGPTLAFKDFGARFMAQCLGHLAAGDEITILTATSGDTGAAVAHAFYRIPGIRVVVLYPDQRISPLQEKLFCTLGENIYTVAVAGDFDVCQDMVKKAFVDDRLQKLHLNSANSINISRLLAQICYYFEAMASVEDPRNTVVAVPSGNFGNLAAGLLARAMGLPVKRFIAATNSNDTVVRYLQTGRWKPEKAVLTSSNAMDVSEPNNWGIEEEVWAGLCMK